MNCVVLPFNGQLNLHHLRIGLQEITSQSQTTVENYFYLHNIKCKQLTLLFGIFSNVSKTPLDVHYVVIKPKYFCPVSIMKPIFYNAAMKNFSCVYRL